MSRLEIASPNRAKIVMEGLYKDLERRIESSPPAYARWIWRVHFWSCVTRRPAANASRAESGWDS